MYYKRTLENIINNLDGQFACITIYGARQVGKSTLIRNVFEDGFKYITMDDSKLRADAEINPSLFLNDHEWPLVIGEIQKAPNILEEIKIRIDNEKHKCLKENKRVPLMYILTGSNHALDNLNKRNNEVDYVITHCCDTKTVLEAFGFRRDVCTDQLNFIDKVVKYKHWFFGHYHFDRNIDKNKTCLYDEIVELE